MKLILRNCIGLVLLLNVFLIHAQTEEGRIKSAIIQYDYMVDNSKAMSLVQYATDYGMLVCYKYDFRGTPFSTIISPDSIFEINYAKRAYKAYPRPESDINFNALTPEIISKYNIQSLGQVEYLAKNCSIYKASIPGNNMITIVTVWIYEGLELRRVTTYSDDKKTDLLATSLEENAEVSPKTFSIPDGFQLIENVNN